MTLMNSHFPVTTVQTVISGFLNPNDQNLFDLKSSLNLPLSTENLRVALVTPQSNINKDLLTEIFFCCIRYICNNDRIALGQIFSAQMEALKDEMDVLLLEEDKEKRAKAIQAIRANLQKENTPSILFNEVKLKNETCCQTLQLAKVKELEFYRNMIKDDALFAKVLTAVEAKHRLLAEGEKLLRNVENQLEDKNLLPKERQQKEDQVQAYKDHLRLSSIENLQKFVPSLLKTPEKVVVVAQRSAVNTEVLIKLLQGQMLTKKSYQPRFFHDDDILHFIKLSNKLDFLYNKEIETNPNSSLLNNSFLDKLLLNLNQIRQEPNNRGIKNAIYLEMQNTIDTLSIESTRSPILNCLEKWQYVHFPQPNHFAKLIDEESLQEEVVTIIPNYVRT
jgi:hypothetical protein